MLYFFMVVCSALMLYGHIQYRVKNAVWGRPLAGGMGVFTIILAIAKIVAIVNEPHEQQVRILDKERGYVYATMQYIGDYLSVQYPEHRILLIAQPVTEQNKERHELMIDGLEKGLNDNLQILAVETPSPLNFDSGSDLDYIFDAELFDRMVKLHPECNMVVSLIGMPADIRKMRFWSLEPEERPKLVVAYGSIRELQSAIKMGFVSAAVTHNWNYKHSLSEPLPENFKDAFERRFILVDRRNIDQIAAEFPTLFVKEEEEDE